VYGYLSLLHMMIIKPVISASARMPASDAKVGILRRRMQRNGFTLVEMISMLIIISILALVALPRFFNSQTFDARVFFDQAQSMLRQAQKIAIAQNRNVHVRLDSTSLAFCFVPFAADGTCSNQVPAPTGKNSGSAATLAICGNSNTWFCEAAPTDVNYASAPVTPYFYFNALGKPFYPANILPISNFSRLDLSFTGGGLTRHLFIEPETGYVHP
jgi:MSHA pilin protein MshC